MKKQEAFNYDDVIAQIISGYAKHPGDDAERLVYLPDKDAVAEIITLLRRLLFPEYFNEWNMCDGRSSAVIAHLISDVEFKLQRQICRALNIDVRMQDNCEDMYCRAGEIVRAFISKIPSLSEILLTDVQAAFEGDPAACSEHEIIFAYPGIFAISVYRMAHELHMLSVPLIPRMMTEYAHSLTGIDIHPGAEISHHFFIDHGTGIVIGETTTIGARAKLYQGVTLGGLSTRGGRSLSGKKRHPTLEEDVTVYAGASILGGDTIIGKGCVIGGSAFITESVPPNTRVLLKNYEMEYTELKK